MNDECISIRSKWILPVDRPPIENGSISIRNGRIETVDKSPCGGKIIDLGAAIVFPQFVNAHTHLEFSDCEKPLGSPSASFASWIKRVIDMRRAKNVSHGDDKKRSAIQVGILESRAAAVAAIGEIGSVPWSNANYSIPSPHCVVFHERLGLSRDTISATVAELDALIGKTQHEAPHLEMGVSPHAPYSTQIELVSQMVAIARARNLPVAMHIAESREELELIRSHSGPLRQLLDELGVWGSDAIPVGTEILDYLKILARCQRSVIIHGNYLTDTELDFVSQNRDRMNVVFCPRTHAFFGHDPYPLQSMLQRGISVSIATDSRASNPDLNMGKEIAFAARTVPSMDCRSLLQLSTLNPARAIGVAADYGTISPGKKADLAIIALPESANADPEAAWLENIASCRPLELDTLSQSVS